MVGIVVPNGFLDVASRLALATLLGAAIGLNRELERKPAGLRTHALVALGAALFSSLGLGMLGTGDVAAPSRVLQGIVAGIGFIGGGVILHRDDTKGVHGLTTAASIWVVCAVGSAAGAGMWAPAVLSVVLALLVLAVGESVDRSLRRALRKHADSSDTE